MTDARLLAAQLASATFVAADDELLAVAQSEGLLVANPNHHGVSPSQFLTKQKEPGE